MCDSQTCILHLHTRISWGETGQYRPWRIKLLAYNTGWQTTALAQCDSVYATEHIGTIRLYRHLTVRNAFNQLRVFTSLSRHRILQQQRTRGVWFVWELMQARIGVGPVCHRLRQYLVRNGRVRDTTLHITAYIQIVMVQNSLHNFDRTKNETNAGNRQATPNPTSPLFYLFSKPNKLVAITHSSNLHMKT